MALLECTEERAEIFEEIERERLYQESKWGPEFDDQNTANDWATYILRYTANTCGFEIDIKEWERQMIKVAALAVAAIESKRRNGHYLPPRHYDDHGGEDE